MEGSDDREMEELRREIAELTQRVETLEEGDVLDRKERNRRVAESVRETVASCGERLRATHFARIIGGESVRIGSNVAFRGVDINGMGGVTIGDNVICARDVVIWSVNHDYDRGDALPYGRHKDMREVLVEDNVWIGRGAFLLPGAVVREGAIVGARAVVTGEVPRCAVVAGNPAAVVKYRDIEKYERAKREGRFRGIVRG